MEPPEPSVPQSAAPVQDRADLEQVRSHLTVVLNDLNLARRLAATSGCHDLRELLDEALDYAERLCAMSRRPAPDRGGTR